MAKAVDERGLVTTISTKPHEQIAKISHKVSLNLALSKDEAKLLLIYLDFVSIASTDNVRVKFDSNLSNLVSRMRKEYSKMYSESAYS